MKNPPPSNHPIPPSPKATGPAGRLKLGDVAAILRAVPALRHPPSPVEPAGPTEPAADATARRRTMLAEFLRLASRPASTSASPPPLIDRPSSPDTSPTVAAAPPSLDQPGLSPRMVQTLRRLLAGDSEKQIAGRLGVSPHTVHVYVKALYRHFEVSSRGELLARFVRLG